MSYDRASPALRKIDRINERIAALYRKREAAVRERGQELGFEPCADCMDGFCTMNCSTAPTTMKAWFP